MEKVKRIRLDHDVKVFGKQVKNFPDGIQETFDSLVEMLPGGFDRPFYGVSIMDPGGKMRYTAAVEEKNAGEAEKYQCDLLAIEKGEYLAVTVKDWRKKKNLINKIFHEIMEDEHVDHAKPAVEWYKNDTEMLCMVRVKD